MCSNYHRKTVFINNIISNELWRDKNEGKNDRTKLGVSFRGIFRLRSFPHFQTLEFFFIQSTPPLSHSASQKKDIFLKKILLLSFKRVGISHSQNTNKTQYHIEINKYMKTNKKLVIINYKNKQAKPSGSVTD